MGEPKHHQIFIDGEKFTVEETTMSGAQIKALANKDASYQLFGEEPGNQPDRLIADTESIVVKSGLHFYTVPVATFGT